LWIEQDAEVACGLIISIFENEIGSFPERVISSDALPIVNRKGAEMSA
jgi:hypothetical protein